MRKKTLKEQQRRESAKRIGKILEDTIITLERHRDALMFTKQDIEKILKDKF